MCNKGSINFEDYKKCLQSNWVTLRSQQRFNSETHNVFTEEVNKIALSSNNDKILQTIDGIALYPYGANAGKVCKTELLQYLNINVKWLILMMLQMKLKQNIMQLGGGF